MQCIYPIILTTITISVLLVALTPKVTEILSMEEYKEQLQDLKFDFEAVCIIIGLIQIVGLFNYTSVTAFSRDGKDAWFVKSIPINMYKQFIYKNLPQVFLNIICSITILSVIHFQIPAIEIKYIFEIFILSILLFFINSYILSLIDLINPKLNWDSEFEILKNNKNKLTQYVLIIFNILFLIYFCKLFINFDLNNAILIFGIFILFIFIILNVAINKYKNKLFKKLR